MFAQSLVVHIQLAAQVGNVLIKSLLVGSLALSPRNQNKHMSRCTCERRVRRHNLQMEELTVCRTTPLLLACRAGESGRVLQTQLAGRVHWLRPQSGVAVSLG